MAKKRSASASAVSCRPVGSKSAGLWPGSDQHLDLLATQELGGPGLQGQDGHGHRGPGGHGEGQESEE